MSPCRASAALPGPAAALVSPAVAAACSARGGDGGAGGCRKAERLRRPVAASRPGRGPRPSRGRPGAAPGSGIPLNAAACSASPPAAAICSVRLALPGSRAPGGHRLRLGGAGQRPGQLAAGPERGLLPAPADVQPDAERPGQQRLQLRDVQDHWPCLLQPVTRPLMQSASQALFDAVLDQACAKGQAGQVGAAAAAGLVPDPVQVGADGADADVQLGGDLGVGAALGDQGDQLPFPGAELARSRRRRRCAGRGR